MKKNTQLYTLFVALLVLGLIETVSGFVLWLALPRGGGGRGASLDSETTFLALSRDTWLTLHDWIAVALVVIIVIHLVLHRKWIFNTTKSAFRRK